VDNLAVVTSLVRLKSSSAKLWGCPGMDCLVQEVLLTRDVLVSEFDGRFGRSSEMGLTVSAGPGKCVVRLVIPWRSDCDTGIVICDLGITHGDG
jgi:hypothetical protein